MNSIQTLKERTKIYSRYLKKDPMSATASAIETTLALLDSKSRKILWDVLSQSRKSMGDERFEDMDDYIDFLEEKEADLQSI